MYPIHRHRRLRTHPSLRALVRETVITPNDFIVPLFVVEGRGIKSEIPSMPGYYRYSLDLLAEELRTLVGLGLKGVLLFAKVPDNLKDNSGKEAMNANGLMQRAIQLIKDTTPELIVMTDVAMDPFSIYGHDGIIKNGKVDNDDTLKVLAEMAVTHAAAGADLVAPSDMMDGRVLAIRTALDDSNHTDVGIMSYSAKYASAHYGPFRDALDSAPADQADVPKDKKTYQMDPGNRAEALKEVRSDVEEGADIVMIKPGICYLDILREVRNTVEVPVAAYQVSGEYAMIKAASERGWLDHDAVMMEHITALKRAGADLIASYFAKEVVRLIS